MNTFDQNGYMFYNISGIYQDRGDVLLNLEESFFRNTVKNAKEVYNYIRLNGPIAKTELQHITGYKLTTLVRAINWLVENKMIFGTNIGESTGGRKPVLYSINPHAAFIIGVDISRTYSKVALMDLECNVIKSQSFGMFIDSTPGSTIKRICILIEKLTAGIDKKKILGIGVGSVGPLNKDKGVILNPLNFPASGWENVPIKEELEKETGFLTIVENGANAAAYGEFKKGAGKGYNNLVYIIAGVGLRLGTVSNGELVKNPSVNEERFGHVIVQVLGKKCSCGNKGCLEAYAAIPVILETFLEQVRKGKTSAAVESVDYDLSAVNFHFFCEAVKKGDELAVEVLNNAALYFSVGLTNLINILNPELIILGGPLAKKCDLFYSTSTALAIENVDKTSPCITKFHRGILGEEAVVIGCGNIVLDYYLQ